MSAAGNKFYVVWRGRQPGVYRTWEDCRGQVHGFAGARYQAFPTAVAAEAALRQGPPALKKNAGGTRPAAPGKAPAAREASSKAPAGLAPHAAALAAGQRVAYTDGGAEGNPGPGGYGVVLLWAEGETIRREELSAGYRHTTNNRMELFGWIAALEATPADSDVALFSDSKYVGDLYAKGNVLRWQQRGWRLSSGQRAANVDLWQRLLRAADRHRHVAFHWVKGHIGHEENERCDRLAAAAPRTAVDQGFEAEKPPASEGLFEDTWL